MTEPTITVPAAPALRWAARVRAFRNSQGIWPTDIDRELADAIDLAAPPPPMPDIVWMPGARVQRRGADGQGAGPVYLLRATVGELVDVVTGADVPALVRVEFCKVSDPSGMYLGTKRDAWLRGDQWCLVDQWHLVDTRHIDVRPDDEFGSGS